MKKALSFIMSGLLLVSVYTLVGCSNQDTPPSEETSAAASIEKDEPKPDYELIYNPVVKDYYDYILSFDKEAEVPVGKNAIAEIILNCNSAEESLSSVGYAINDVNIDGIDELLICPTEEEMGEGTSIFAIFTCVDGNPQLIEEGWYKSRYYLMDNGSFFYYGSGGAAYQSFGTYKIANNLRELKSTKFYFTAMNDAQQAFYTNNTGEENIDKSTEISRESFWAEHDQLITRTVDIKVTAFSEISEDTFAENSKDNKLSYVVVGLAENFVEPEIMEKWESNRTIPYETFVADNSEDGIALAFMQNEGGNISDFKFYVFENVDFVNDKLVFDKREIYSRDALSSTEPILIKMTFNGTMPSYGFSYVDEESTKYFSLNLSGYDGSVMVEEAII